jgi:hypothetical protein
MKFICMDRSGDAVDVIRLPERSMQITVALEFNELRIRADGAGPRAANHPVSHRAFSPPWIQLAPGYFSRERHSVAYEQSREMKG